MSETAVVLSPGRRRERAVGTQPSVSGAGVFWFGVPLVLYHFLMIERKRSVLLERGPFLLAEHLNLLEKVLYCIVFPLEILLLLATISAVVERLSRPVLRRFCWGVNAVIAFCYFGLASAQYEAFGYIKDALTLAVIRSLGGGDLWHAFSYVRDEIAALLPALLAAAVVLVAAVWGLLHSQKIWRCAGGPPLAWLLRPQRLILGNLLMFILVPALSLLSSPLSRALSFTLVHEIYMFPAGYLTDFDRDGYSLVSRPADFAPFDHSRHPYALEIPGNGVDEDGIGGDLKTVIRKPLIGPWDAGKLQRRNVVFIVLESARADALDATVEGQPVMPALQKLPGQRIAMFSHAGYTTPSLCAMMTGSLFAGEGISLIARFKEMGYRTGVFSAQAEDFGGIAANNHLRNADAFFDANSFPKERRMYSSTVPAALGVPAGVVNAEFAQWCGRQADPTQPFFAYLNWQEMHFPYYHQREPKLLLTEPIPRSKINLENREWLWRTYLNAARSIDDALAEVANILRSLGALDRTVMFVVGDHGEELFDHGYLGHGTNICYEQNAALCKLINSDWKVPQGPLGSTDVSSIIHNALVQSQGNALPLSNEILCHVGPLETPIQIGLFTNSGLTRYNFNTGAWTRQTGPGSDFSPSTTIDHVVHVWESSLIEHAERSRSTMRAPDGK